MTGYLITPMSTAATGGASTGIARLATDDPTRSEFLSTRDPDPGFCDGPVEVFKSEELNNSKSTLAETFPSFGVFGPLSFLLLSCDVASEISAGSAVLKSDL